MFLTRLLSDCYALIFELSAWTGLVASGILSYTFVHYRMPQYAQAAWVVALFSVAAAFLIEVMLWGTIAMLIDVRNSLRDMARHGTR